VGTYDGMSSQFSGDGFSGMRFHAIAMSQDAIVLRLAWTGRETSDERSWARRVFACSLLVVTVLSIMMAVDSA
jgi:protoheme IX farnesyltransferase